MSALEMWVNIAAWTAIMFAPLHRPAPKIARRTHQRLVVRVEQCHRGEDGRHPGPGAAGEHPGAEPGVEAPERLRGDGDAEHLDERGQPGLQRRAVLDELQEDRREVEAAQERAEREPDDDVGGAKQTIGEQRQSQQRIGGAQREARERARQARPPIPVARIAGESQPSTDPSLTAYMNARQPDAGEHEPAHVQPAGARRPVSARNSWEKTIIAAPTGTLTKNTHRHETYSVNAPPSTGARPGPISTGTISVRATARAARGPGTCGRASPCPSA